MAKNNKNSRKKKKAQNKAKSQANQPKQNQAKAQTNQNNNIENKSQEDKKQPTPLDTKKGWDYKMLFIPIILVLGYLPVLMRTLDFKTYIEDYDWALITDTDRADIFLKIKAIVLIVITVFMILVMLMRFFNGHREDFKKLKSLPFYLIAGAVVFVILSGIFAANKALLFLGSFENFESIFVTIAYFVVMVYTFVMFHQSDNIYRDFRFVYRGAIPGFLITAIIGFFQVFGLDFFKTDFGGLFFLAAKYRSADAQVTVGEGEYTTLHNIDYVSIFFAMWAFIFLMLIFTTKDTKQRIARGALLALALFDMWMAGTDGGRLGFAAALVLLLIMISIGHTKRLVISIVAVLAAVALVLIIPQTRNYIINGIGWVDKDPTTSYRLHHITPKDDGVYFDLDGKEYSVAYTFDNGNSQTGHLIVTLRDANGNPIEGTFKQEGAQTYTYNEGITPGTEISECYYKADQSDKKAKATEGLQIVSGDLAIMISNQVDKSGDYYFLDYYGKFVQDDGTDIANVHLFPSELFSGRGDIWNKTIPLLKDHLLIGCGSGLFLIEFPQGCYIDRLMGSATTYDVKPHNLYMQWWVEEGLPYLLLLLVFFVLYYISAFKGLGVLARKKDELTDEEKINKYISIGCVCAVTVFLVSGLVSDSMVVHSPVFWTFTGLGVAVAMRMRDDNALQ